MAREIVVCIEGNFLCKELAIQINTDMQVQK